MLLELRIRNFAIIEQAGLQFGPGLNVLSGETGAGKTIIMTALGLLLGARASPELIGAADGEANVEGLFQLEGEGAIGEGIEGLPELGDGRDLAIRRTIADGGRSRAYLNGEIATVQMLAKIGAGLVQIYGQHEQQSLLRVESHLQVVDRHAGTDAALERYRGAWRTALVARATLDDLAARERGRAEALELARFRVAELDRAAPVGGEDETLAAERTVLANAARLAAAAAEAEEMLAGAERAAIDAIARAEARVAEAAALDAALRAPLELIAAGRVNLQEAADALRAYAGRIEADPARLEEVETRIAELNRLKRKYGGTLASAIETLERSRAEIAELEAVAESRGKAEAQLAHALDRLAEAAAELSRARRANAADLKRRMEAELKTLGMRAAVFEARFTRLDAAGAGLVHNGAAFGPNGADAVEFMLSPNLSRRWRSRASRRAASCRA